MDDEAQKESIFIDEKQLSKILGKPCIKTSAAKKKGITKLLDEIIFKFQNEKTSSKLFYSDAIEEEIANILEEDINVIQKICEAAEKCEPKYEAEKAWLEYLKIRNN